jgi:uncharacterized protein (DUF4213/DUF364 family)
MPAMKDPVLALSESFPYDPEKILASSRGAAYISIMLANGRIGVCSTLSQPVETDPLLLVKPDLKRPDHRMLVTAFANAHVNYTQNNLESGDIFDRIDFKKKKQTLMVGYFPPLAEKFRKDGIFFTAFDEQKNLPELTPQSQFEEKIGLSDCVIITSTTLINSTLTRILSLISPGTETYLLGPSTPLYPDLKEHYPITGLYGMTFNPYDFEVLDMISKGLGTQAFGKKGKKVSL